MAGGAHKGNEPITSINVTPLVDVMLVLLIIFMVTANFLNSQAIPIELPEAATGEPIDQVLNLAFVVDAESQIYLDGKPFSLPELPEKIALLRAEGKSLQALIGADKSAPYGSVVTLIDALRENGVAEFAINIDPR